MTLLTRPRGLRRVSGTAGLLPGALIPANHKSKEKSASDREREVGEDEGQIIMSFSAHCFLYAPKISFI